MHQTTGTTLDQRIKRFISRLKKNHNAEIVENPRIFRSRVIGKVRAGLPRKRPGRKGTPEVKKAAEIYRARMASHLIIYYFGHTPWCEGRSDPMCLSNYRNHQDLPITRW
ncbi:MAG TPA: hypothetical protein VMW38_15715 [Terriglobia bacterium]|nr:hypothetical protein [Terriglobia bacterium]